MAEISFVRFHVAIELLESGDRVSLQPVQEYLEGAGVAYPSKDGILFIGRADIGDTVWETMWKGKKYAKNIHEALPLETVEQWLNS